METLFDMGHLTAAELKAGLAEVLASSRTDGTLHMIVQRPKVDARIVIDKGTLDVEKGLVGDNWLTKGSRWRRGGDPERQITVMNWRFALLVAGGDETKVPIAGDQLYVDLDLSKDNLAPGSRLRIGAEAVIEVTKPPHLACKKFVERFGRDAMTFANSDFGKAHNLRGINAKVIRGGEIFAGDTVTKIN